VAVKAATAASSWTPLFGTTVHPASGRDGTIAIDIPAFGAVLLGADAQVPSPAPAAPTLKVAGDTLSNLWAATATLKGTAPASVTFAANRAGRWRRLTVDDSPPYRAFLDPAKYRNNERVQVAAIARSLDGRTAVSKIVRFTIRRR
jgi:hypothetical protein